MKRFFKRKLPVASLLLMLFFPAFSQGTFVSWSTIPKSGTALVLTHMDDDVIWMLPWWKITEKFICGAMPPTPVYQTVVDQQQDYLDANGYNIDYRSNWLTPWGMITQRQYSDYYWDDLPDAQYLAEDHLIAYWDNNDLQLVRTEINRIKAKLEQYISQPDISRIITHNNWGEYGHQQHRAINKAVRELAVKYRKDVWMLGCDNGEFVDVDVPNGITYTMGSFDDPTLFTSIRTIYKNNWCWTWPDDIPSGDHKFIKIVEGGVDKSNILTGESVTYSGPSQDEPGAYIFDGVDDYMTLVGNSSSSFTIAMRVRPDIIRNMDISMMSEYPGNSASDRNFYMNSNGTVSARIYDGSSKVVTSTTALNTGTWTFIAMTGDGSSLKLYVNGVLESESSTGSAITSYDSPEFVMGQAGMTSSFFSGQLNDVSIYDRALSESEVAALSGVVYTITASAGTGGTITPSGNVPVVIGSNSAFSITPATDYLVSDVVVDNISRGVINTYTFYSVQSNHTISATFVPKVKHTITASPGDHGSITPSGAVTVADGNTQAFTISANTGYRISDVTVDGASVGAVTQYTFNNVVADHTISVQYETVPTFTITAGSGTGGSINPSGSIVVSEGSGQSFSITANSGYRITGVLVDGNSMGAISSYTFSNITTNHSISASFAMIPVYTITANAGEGGSISPSGSIMVIEGAGQSFNILPNSGYRITNVQVDGNSMGAITSYTFSNVTSNHGISASFEMIPVYTITANAGNGGSINPSGNISVNEGNDRSFSINASPGYAVSDVLVDNYSVGAVSQYTFSNVSADHTISVTFEVLTYEISASAGTGGSINPSGTMTVNWGTSRTFTIVPATGYEISGVRIDNVLEGTMSSYTFSNITSNHTISATFAPITYTISATAGAGGSLSPSGNVSVTYGTGRSFTINPDAGHYITDVIVDNVSAGPVTSYTFDNVTSNHSISASFAVYTFTLNASAGSGGTISPAGSTTVNYGTDHTYTISPDPGYRVEDLLVDNISAGELTSYTFSGVTSNHSISASFTRIIYSITASAGQGGRLTPSGITSLEYGESRSYNIEADNGYDISDVRIDGISAGAIQSYTFSNVAANHTISASFAPKTYTIESTSGSGGNISPSGIVTVQHGNDQVYIITPSAGFGIEDVMVDNSSAGRVPEYHFTGITGNHSISATFSVLRYSVTAYAGTGGSVSPSGTITTDYGSAETYTITPEEGYYIGDVKVDGESVGPVDSYTLENITADHSISVVFAIRTFTITTNPGTNGTISPAGQLIADYGTDQTVTITPDFGYKITDVIVDNESVGPVSSYTFGNVTDNHTVSATFEYVNLYSIKASAGTGGKINPVGTTVVPEESNQTYEITPEKGYRILNVEVDNVDQGSLSEYTFSAVNSDHNISAEFTSETKVTVYPNPFTDAFRIKIESPLPGNFELYVFDVASRVVYYRDDVTGDALTTVNMQSKSKGVYIVRLYYDKVQVYTVKVLKF